MGFASGFKMGSDIGFRRQDAERQKVLDDRATEEFGFRRAALQREQTDAANVDTAFANYNNVQAGISPDTQAQLSRTYGMNPQQVASAAQAGGVEGLRSRLTGYDTPDNYDLQSGGIAPTDAVPRPVRPGFNAAGLNGSAPTEISRIRGLELIAAARKDVASMERLGTARVGAEENALVTAAFKEYTGADDQIGQTAQYLNKNSSRVTMGKPDKDGFVRMSIVNADGGAEFLKLPKQDQAQLYAAAKLMESNPTKALAMMSGVNKELAAAIAVENGLTDKLGTNSNDVANKSGTLGVAQKNAATNEKYREDQQRIQQQTADQMGVYQRGSLAVQQTNANQRNKEADPKLVKENNRLFMEFSNEADPAKRKVIERQMQMVQNSIATSMGKPQMLPNARDERLQDPSKYFTAVKAATDSGAYKTPGEARAAVDQMFGIVPSTNVGIRLQKENEAAGKAKAPIIVQPGENGIRPAGSTVMGDPNNFQRTSVRGLFGGLSYVYVDPVTQKKFTAEQYNQLFAQ